MVEDLWHSGTTELARHWCTDQFLSAQYGMLSGPVDFLGLTAHRVRPTSCPPDRGVMPCGSSYASVAAALKHAKMMFSYCTLAVTCLWHSLHISWSWCSSDILNLNHLHITEPLLFCLPTNSSSVCSADVVASSLFFEECSPVPCAWRIMGRSRGEQC